MKRRAKLVLGIVLVAVLAGGAAAATRKIKGDKNDGPKTVDVVRGTLVDKALAVGTIEPRVEVSVKSILPGVVERRYAEVGDYVRKGQPLLQIRPNPTPLQLVERRRDVEFREIELKNTERDLVRQRELRQRDLTSQADLDLAERRYEEAQLQVKLASERLSLAERGEVDDKGGRVETVVRAPIDGFILEKSVENGDPVTPLTDFQEGTVLMKMAAMKDLIFRGTVDEIDVGRLQEGMPADIKIGALPSAAVRGKLDKIWLKARKEEQATVFPIEIVLTDAAGATLRAGYSANAEVIIARRDSVLVIPERLVTLRNDSAFVTLLGAGGTTQERPIKTGLSDAINIEVLEGLRQGDKVVEKPPREIS